MAHIPPSAAIFSPSVARLATSAAKDWNYVDTWLSTKFHGRPPPFFERNAETLKTLVALVAFNESVDEDRDAVISSEAPVLRLLSQGANINADGIKATDTAGADDPRMLLATVARRILATIEDVLSREGHAALGGLTSVSVELGNICPEVADLGRGVMELHARLFQRQRAASANDTLKAHVTTGCYSATSVLGELDNNQYQPPAGLARLNLELQRKVKAGSDRLQDTRERTNDSAMLPSDTVPRLQESERTYMDLLTHSKKLDKKIREFQGLPPDKDLLRRQLEELYAELRIISQKRDNVFESLVDKTSPGKHRA